VRAVGARCALGVALGACALPHVAYAGEDQPPPLAPVTAPSLETPEVQKSSSASALRAPLAGAFTAFLPLVVGSLLLAQDDRPGLQRAGVTTIVAGFAVAPWVAHVGSGRWGRVAAFGAASLAASAATWIVMQANDPFDPNLGNHKRIPFGVLFTSAFFFGALGVADGFLVAPSRREP
jgi:hypothetical protein